MSRKPRKANSRQVNFILPKGVRVVNNRIVYRPYIPQAQRKQFETDQHGYLKPPIKLGRVGDSETSIYKAYTAILEQHQYQQDPNYLTLNWLYQQYLQSRQYRQEIEAETRRRYQQCSIILQEPIKIDGKPATLGDLRSDHLKTTIVRKIMDKRYERYQAEGKSGASQCNNEKALLSAMYAYGIQYIEELAPLKNPCHGVKKFAVDARTRYVTDEEYAIQYQFAQTLNIPYLPIVMELSYLLAARGVEVTLLKIGDATDEGIIVRRKKGSRTTLIRWTPRLKAAWESAIAQHKNPHPDVKLLKAARGSGSVTKAAIDNTWQNLKNKMIGAGLAHVYFWLHDLKRKGISDAADDKIAGHISDSTRSNYNVKIQQFDAPN